MNSASGSNPQSVWTETSRKNIKRRVRDDWGDEQKYRNEFSQPLIVGYRIIAGKNCPHAKPYDGLVFLIEDIYDEPDLLPPYEGCMYETCKCEFVRVMSDEGGKAKIVLEFGNPELQAKLTTRKSSPVGYERSLRGRTAREARQINWKESSGCASVLLVGLGFLSLFVGAAVKLKLIK